MSDAALLMDKMYRRQRHIYDLSRKYYLIGRDEAIARLRPASGESVLEIGCGTGRNLVKAARAYPRAKFFGIDVSREMLDTAAASIRARRAEFAHNNRSGRRDGLRSHAAFRAGAVRARDDFLRPVDDPALARGARAAPSTSSRRAVRSMSSISATAPAGQGRSGRPCAAGLPHST